MHAPRRAAVQGGTVERIVKGEFNAAAHGLRGIAALMVLGAHIMFGTGKHVYPHDAVYKAAIMAPWYLGTFGVHLFFIISGFVILPSALRYAPREFALRRGLRIYPLFFALSVLFVCLNAYLNAYPKVNNWEAVVAGFLFLNLFTGTDQLTPNAWSLTYEVCFYVLTGLLVHVAWRRFRPLAAAAAIAAAALFLVAFPMTVYFVAGAAIRVLHARGLRVDHARWWEAAFFIAAVFFASRGHFEYRWADFADPRLVPIIVSAVLYFNFAAMPGSLTERMVSGRFLAYTGTISYSLYLVHPYVYLGLRKIFAAHGWFGPDPFLAVPLFAVPVVILSFAASHVVHVALERWPYRWFFHQRIYRGDGSADVEAAPAEPAPALRERRA